VQVKSLVTNSNNGLDMPGEIKIMSKVDPDHWRCDQRSFEI